MDGKDGDIGPSGFVSLITTTTVNIGDENCPDGGTRIDTGIDNGDGEDGIAGNEILEPGEIDITTYICNESNDNGQRFFSENFNVANFGSDNLDGFTSVTISDRYPNENVQNEIRMSMYVDKSVEPDSISRERSLVRFGGLRDAIDAKVIESFPDRSVRLNKVHGATMYVLMLRAPFDASVGSYGDIDFVEFGPLSMNSSIFPEVNTGEEIIDDYDAETVTWNEIAPGASWNVPGIFRIDSTRDRKDDYEQISNGFNPILASVWYAFRLDTSRVDIDYLSDFRNRGFLMSLNEGFIEKRGSAVNVQMSLLQVVLNLEVEMEDLEVDVNGRASNNGGKKVKPWNERTEAEKFTPLYRYLNKQ